MLLLSSSDSSSFHHSIPTLSNVAGGRHCVVCGGTFYGIGWSVGSASVNVMTLAVRVDVIKLEIATRTRRKKARLGRLEL